MPSPATSSSSSVVPAAVDEKKVAQNNVDSFFMRNIMRCDGEDVLYEMCCDMDDMDGLEIGLFGCCWVSCESGLGLG
ncbi:hypothetical protein FRB94_000831 [Tulasnella sp. JGI-2019a]|nr:hypothetical protein FRB94_000831 [Tulasnella sp. JGI-2019a]